ncbi:type I-E CRISPR-associated protein Cse2/CasB [Kocuria koreensis]|jgi:CRISPR system Cascade subunit CasB|uniref:Type I-E CRISPR-associated protein Cse2/CasB n=1 Tax=Rothia koreensis TaxID=592378 RepID=A0A7K1LI52_9MICC|nr:type I-E CRISPR-associated protein Cse2/CasB [Rothia koreensis]MUN54867.1 type I-E CRISPR-associated protein Cse2/CasB [Rothia koreensis]
MNERHTGMKPREFVRSRIRGLVAATEAGRTDVPARLAALRRGVGKMPGTDPSIWEVTLEGLDVPVSRANSSPTAEEWAAHLALTSFALHQQSISEPMQRSERTFGEAIRLLEAARGENGGGVRRRLDALVTASSGAEFQHHLGALIRMLRAERIGFDYPRFAAEITRFLNPRTRSRAQLEWARQYSRTTLAPVLAGNSTTTDQEQS